MMPQGQSVDEQPTVAKQLQDSLRNLVIATVVLYLGLATMAVSLYISGQHQSQDTEQLAITTTAALCALRFDLQTRVEDSQKFLKQHPNGVAGIPAKSIQQSIEGQQRTIASLSILDCPDEVTQEIPPSGSP